MTSNGGFGAGEAMGSSSIGWRAGWSRGGRIGCRGDNPLPGPAAAACRSSSGPPPGGVRGAQSCDDGVGTMSRTWLLLPVHGTGDGWAQRLWFPGLRNACSCTPVPRRAPRSHRNGTTPCSTSSNIGMCSGARCRSPELCSLWIRASRPGRSRTQHSIMVDHQGSASLQSPASTPARSRQFPVQGMRKHLFRSWFAAWRHGRNHS